MTTLALIFTMLLFVYHQLVLHFDFFPFNNIESISRRLRMWESLISGVICLFTLLAFRLEHRILMLTASGMLGLFSIERLWNLFTKIIFEPRQLILLILLVLSFLFTLLSHITN